MLDEKKRYELKATANEIRKWALDMMQSLSQGTTGVHVGGSMSIIDILTVLYFDQMNIKPEDPKWPDRDRFILSKGHAGPGLYAVLARRGYFPKEMLYTLNRPKTNLPSHCDRIRTPGVDMTCGSLGQGISAAVGQALAAKMQNRKSTVYCMVGDGEMEEGQVWEAAMFAGAHQLDNLIVFVDSNGLQIGGTIEYVENYGDPGKLFGAFGFEVIDNVNGHDVDAIQEAIVKAKAIRKPVCIVCNTVKGKGFKPAEGERRVHSMPVSYDDYVASCAYIDETC